jgi:serine/threonine protein kinase
MLTYKSFPYDIENFENKLEILDKISQGEYNNTKIRIRYPVTRLISEELDDLFTKIFKVNPEERITIEEMLDHAWINKNRINLRDLCKYENFF